MNDLSIKKEAFSVFHKRNENQTSMGEIRMFADALAAALEDVGFINLNKPGAEMGSDLFSIVGGDQPDPHKSLRVTIMGDSQGGAECRSGNTLSIDFTLDEDHKAVAHVRPGYGTATNHFKIIYPQFDEARASRFDWKDRQSALLPSLVSWVLDNAGRDVAANLVPATAAPKVDLRRAAPQP